MPNGFHGSVEEWDRIESPLQQIDLELAAFAERHGLEFSKNVRNWPDRRLTWGEPIHRSIQISLVDDEGPPLYAVGGFAWEDRAFGRYVKGVSITEPVPISVLREKPAKWLEEGLQIVSGWTSDDLEFAGPL